MPTTAADALEHLEQTFAGRLGDMMVGGHTHIQMFRRYNDMLVLNPGSVGLAMDRVSPMDEIRQPVWAEYAIIECDETSLRVELQRVSFNLSAFIQAMNVSGMPHAGWRASCWKEAW